ncbi:MAG: helix-turn-helix transcriptional regulator [Chitinivibrionales bacterium]|nr:helix-turn-helix transcriptional regulator [Chitinivibrionales bacterium]
MLKSRNELMEMFGNPAFVPHPRFNGMVTFPGMSSWITAPLRIILPATILEIYSIDYVRAGPSEDGKTAQFDHFLRFQQNAFRLWYQIDGQGILQNATKNNFGSTHPGLLGVMDTGQRHAYLHQRGDFECFVMEFALLPSNQTKYFWNWEVEGKCVLAEHERVIFENHLFNLLLAVATGRDFQGIAPAAGMLEIILTGFQKKLITFSQAQFPKNKSHLLVQKAQHFMQRNFVSLQHQELLAQECGVDINYLNIVFKKETGRTLFQFLTTVRMEHAKHLLEEGTLPIIAIASRVGYPNNNSFARAFRKFLKESPSEYRKKHSAQSSSK